MKSFTTLLALALLCLCTLFSAAQQSDTLEIQRNQKGKVSFARFKPGVNRNMQEAASFIKTILRTNPEDEFRLQKENRDQTGILHRRYDQYYRGIKVDNTQYLVHGRNGMIETMNGDFQDVHLSSVRPSLTEKQALGKALAYVNAKKYKWQDEGTEKYIKQQTKNPQASYYPQGELVISKDYIKEKSPLRLAWKFNISSMVPHDEQWVYIDAQTGEAMGAVSRILHANVNCKADTYYNGTNIDIIGDSFGGGYRLRETRHGVDIVTLNLQNTSYNFGGAVDFVNNNTYFTDGAWSTWWQDRQATDAHWAAEKTLDYWVSVHNRNSIDDNGMAVKTYVHAGNNFVNAFYEPFPTYAAVLGDGDGVNCTSFTSLDQVAHELGHGITHFTSTLSGSGETRALNEGFSDIWAVCVGLYAEPSNNLVWLYGRQVVLGGKNAMRNLSNPHDANLANGYRYPNTYQGQYWDVLGEPHINSAVLTHWFYLLVNGGSGWNNGQTSHASSGGYQWQVCGTGISDAEKIAYKAQDYLASNSTYSDARNATISAAIDLFGSGSCEHIAVANAWNAVGIGSAISYPVNNYTISNQTSFCSSYTYSVSPTPPAGSTVTWSAYPYDAVTLSPNGSQVTATTLYGGTFNLSATITDCCTTVTKSQNNIQAGANWSGYVTTSRDQPVYLVSFPGGNGICEDSWVYLHLDGVTSGSQFTFSTGNIPHTYYWDGYNWNFYMPPGSNVTFAVNMTVSGCTQTVYFLFQSVECGYYNATVRGQAGFQVPAEANAENIKGTYTIAPNPASAELTIYAKTDQYINRRGYQRMRKVEIVDMTGKVHMQQHYPLNATKMSMSISQLSAAMYIARIYDGEKWTSIKFIKK